MYTIEEKIHFEIPLTADEARTLLEQLNAAEADLDYLRDVFVGVFGPADVPEKPGKGGSNE
jgi:hypothetical protein